MNEALLLVARATQEYNRGQLDTAGQYARQAADLLKPMVEATNFRHMAFTEQSPLFSYLNALTLLQSIASRQHNLTAYESYEAAVRDCMQAAFGNLWKSYYAIHLLDACECYLNAGDVANAGWRLETAISILEEENGSCTLISFLHASYNAKLHFHLKQYYDCIAACLNANSLWLEKPLIPEQATAFLQHYAANEALIANSGVSNLILLGCALGKINNHEEALTILVPLSQEPPEDYYLRASLELILAEVYTRAGMLCEAREIYNKYRGQNIRQYSDLNVTLHTLALLLEDENTTVGLPLYTADHDGHLPATTCYSRDAFEILLYNQGLNLIQQEQYTQALSLYQQLGDRGLSLKLFLLAKTRNYAAIFPGKKAADKYFDREIRNLFLYYNEKLVYNHLSLLEYHFSLCMNAYLECYENLGRQAMPPEEIYDFLLNTKGISMEAAYLSRQYQSLDALNNRKVITSSEIQSALSEQELLIEYCITQTLSESYYCAFFITRNQIHCIRLAKEQTINGLLNTWHTLLQQSAPGNAADTSATTREMRENDTYLRRHLFRPMKEFLDTATPKNIIISPAGALVQFPFSRLSISAGSYLGEHYQITYINTAKELITNPPLADNRPTSALILGNPTITGYPPLPYAEQEAEIAAAYLQAPCYTGEQATLSLLEHCQSEPSDLLHIATHGIFHKASVTTHMPDWNTAFQTMDNSGLLLAGNELLSCNAISVMDFSGTALTVLSACQTGQGIFHASEGVYGLRRAFRLAGCHNMIMSLWQVDDRCGCYFMERFYQHFLKCGKTKEQAFSLAVNDLLSYEENGIRPFSHPYFWAGYILIR